MLDGACNARETDEKCTHNFSLSRDYLGNIYEDGTIILNLVLKIYSIRMWTLLNRIKVG
jgi:hypothetical protein